MCTLLSLSLSLPPVARSQVLLRQIDLVPEQKRTGKYLNEIEELRNRVMKLLKQKEPDFVSQRQVAGVRGVVVGLF